MATDTPPFDYAKVPKSKRGGPAMAAHIAKWAARGGYELKSDECFWRDIQPFLLSKGYRLRPRYAPGWKAPWIGTDISPSYFEESQTLNLPGVIDARRTSDDLTVAIKWIPHAEHTRDELEVHRFLSTDDKLADPQNHCAPLLDTFAHPSDSSGVFIVLPWLDDIIGLPLQHVNEVVDMMLQTFEGLVFMHKHLVAHRDCTGWNIMQDATSAFPGRRCHPLEIKYSEDLQTYWDPLPRCMCSFRYYFIDFGLSTRFEGPGPYRVTGAMGRDPSPPELSETVPYDPFKLDVFVLGNNYLQRYVHKCTNLNFLRPLLLHMTRADPDSRPTAEEALRALRAVATRPSGVAFRWRLRRRNDGLLSAVVRDINCVFWEVYLQLRGALLRTRRELDFGRPQP